MQAAFLVEKGVPQHALLPVAPGARGPASAAGGQPMFRFCRITAKLIYWPDGRCDYVVVVALALMIESLLCCAGGARCGCRSWFVPSVPVCAVRCRFDACLQACK